MTRSSIAATMVLSVALSVACNNAMDDQQKANTAQNEANDKIARAAKEAQQKSIQAQAEADKQIAEAKANFMRLREDYRHATTTNLVGLDHQVADLEAKGKQLTGKAATDFADKLRDIRNRRATFSTDYDAIEAASATTWDDTKARLDKAWAELKTIVDKA